jgi:hypothetical protein
VLVTDLGSETIITWEIFKNEFNLHFFPRVVQEAKAREFLDLVQGGMSVIEYAAKFLQLSQFDMYLIPNEEKKAKKFEQVYELSYSNYDEFFFNIRDFPQLVDRASIYEEILKENATKYMDQKRTAQGPNTLVGGARPAKRIVVGSFPLERSQGHTSGNRPVLPQKSHILELCRKCNKGQWEPCRMATTTCYRRRANLVTLERIV